MAVGKVTSLEDKFGLTGVGWRLFFNQWIGDLTDKVTNKSTVEDCHEILNTFRLGNFANKENIETVEVSLVGWDKHNKPKFYYFHNGGYAEIKSAAHCTGKGGNAAWMALVNKSVKTMREDDAVRAAQRAIYDAYLSDSTTGEGVDVLVLRFNEKPDRNKYRFKTMKELSDEFGHKPTYMQCFNAGVGPSNPSIINEGGSWIGTTTAGFVLRKAVCVILAADMEKGNASEKQATEKVFQLAKKEGENEGFSLSQGYTRAGGQKDVNCMRAHLEHYARENKGASDITEMPEYVLKKVGESTEIPTAHRGHLLLGGYNKNSDVPHFYYINNAGVLDLTNVDIKALENRFQTGSGSGAAFVLLNKWYDPDMSEKKGIYLAQLCIYNGIKNDSHTGLGIEVLVIKPSGVRKISLTTTQFEEEMRKRESRS